jgi:hypothetical protein
MTKKRCFVVMGFGEKTDLATGRTLDLDKTYRIIIRKAVEEAGLECIRADDIIHSGVIDAPMYELLLEADIVIADLSTANPNAIYELGVRHALRPQTTIVIAEKQFKFPFDISHLVIQPYEHLGKGIDAEEAERVRARLIEMINALVDAGKVDSPVYAFLPRLHAWNTAVTPILQEAGTVPPAAAAVADQTATVLMDMFRDAKKKPDWPLVESLLLQLLARRPSDPYLKQQLALATYKGKRPDVVAALLKAKSILEELNPSTSTDPETLGLWGAVHKRLFEETDDRAHLDAGIWAYEKGFYLKNDYYNGINLAYMLNVRASTSQGREAVADTVVAERTRRRVIEICNRVLEAGIRVDDGKIDEEETFWVQASLVEALLGSGQADRANALREKLAKSAPQWMLDSMNDQLGKLGKLLAASPA